MVVGEQLLEAGANTDSRERVRGNGMRFMQSKCTEMFMS